MALSVGIDLGASAIKVVAGRKKGPLFEVQRAFSLPVGGEPQDHIPALASELGKAPGARFSLSGSDLIIRYVQIPPVPQWRLDLLMDLEVQSMAEKSQDQLAHDYNLLGLLGKDEETVLLAVVRQHLLDERYAALKQAVGEPQSGVPSAIALFNSYAHCGEFHEGEVLLLVDVGEQATEVVLLKEGEMLFARHLNSGGGALTQAIADSFDLQWHEAEQVKLEVGNAAPRGSVEYGSGREEKVANALATPVGQLSSMVQSSVGFARAQTGIADLKPGRILLTGGGANLRGLDRYFETAFDCPVERYQPESGLDLSALPDDEAAAFEADPGSFASAVGLAVSGQGENSFNVELIPTAAKKKRDFAQRTVWLILAAVLAVGFLGMHASELMGESETLEKEAKRQKRVARSAQRKREAYEREVTLLRDRNVRLDRLVRETGTAPLLLRVQGLLQAAASEDVWIREVRVSYEDQGQGRGRNRVVDMRPMVRVEGTITGDSSTPGELLRDLNSKVERAAPDLDVSYTSEEKGRRLMEFVMSVRHKAKSAAQEGQ